MQPKSPAEFLSRHVNCDWGDLCDEDRRLNDEAILDGSRIISSYTLRDGKTTLWVISEADRSVSTILRPEDY